MVCLPCRGRFADFHYPDAGPRRRSAGILWEMTSQMVMEGMPMAMPPRTMKLCTARQWTRPPPGGDKTCVNSN